VVNIFSILDYPTPEQQSQTEVEHPGWRHNAGNRYRHVSGASLDVGHGYLFLPDDGKHIDLRADAFNHPGPLQNAYFEAAEKRLQASAWAADPPTDVNSNGGYRGEQSD